jgi:tetratricopeptide (TPR) repeat protein
MSRLFLATLLLPATLAAQSFDDLLKTGRAQLDSGKSGDAVKTLERAVKMNPQSAEAHFRLGNALGSEAGKANPLRQPFLAKRLKAEFEKAVELDPNLVSAREGLIQFYLQAPGVMGGSVPKAREQASEIARINALRGHFAAAQIANNQKDVAGAEKAYRAAATEFPDSLGAVTSWVNFLTTNGRADEAFTSLDRFLASHPNDRVARWWIGRTAAISGKQLDRGEQILRGLLAEQQPTDGPRILPENIHFRLGDIAAKRGDKAKARAEYQEALKLNPKHEPAKKALAAL